VAAIRAEFSVGRNFIVTFRTGEFIHSAWFFGAIRPGKILGKHGRHHKTQTGSHTHARAGGFGLRSFFHGHGSFHLHEFIHVVEDTHTAAVVNGFLNFGWGCNRIQIQVGQSQAEMAEILLQSSHKPFCQFVILGRQVQNGVDGFSHVIIEPGHDDTIQVFIHLCRGEDPLGTNHAVDKQYRLHDLNIKNTKCP